MIVLRLDEWLSDFANTLYPDELLDKHIRSTVRNFVTGAPFHSPDPHVVLSLGFVAFM